MPKNEAEYRAMPVMSGDGEEENRVRGYATTFNDPYLLYEYDGEKMYEVVDRNALEGADMSDVIMQYDHHGKVLARQSNGTLTLTPDEQGLMVSADLSKSQAARDMYEEIRNGLVTRMSWAFVVAEDRVDHDREARTYTRTILRVKKVYDVSAVGIPADPNTYIAARAAFDGVIEAERRRDLEREKLRLKLKIGGTKA